MTGMCLAKRGFFTLRGCDRPAMKNCEQCGQPTCKQHLSMRTGMKFCMDCAAKQAQQTDTGNVYDDDWTYSYRSGFYSRGYSPYGYGYHDYQSFNERNDEIDDADGDGTPDFSDS